MTINSVYEVPTALQDYILRERGNPASGSTARREVLDTLRGQWSSLIDTMTFGQMNDLIGIKRLANGQLRPTYAADHTYNDGVLLAIPYRFITKELVEKFLAEYIGWLKPEFEMDSDGSTIRTLTVRPEEGTSMLRTRAFAEAVARAKENLRGVVSSASSSSGTNPGLAFEAVSGATRTGNRSGVMVYQVYWLLLVAKEVRDNLTELMRSALRVTRNEAEVKVIKRDTGAGFTTFADKHRRRLLAANQGRASIENLPLPPEGAETPRTWGIEVESAGALGVPNPGGGWSRKGDGSLSSAYGMGRHPGNCPDHDHSSYDGKCAWLDQNRVVDREYSATAEFVSPPMGTAHSEELRTLIEQLAREPQNDTAGVHVHVDAADLTPRNIGALVFAYQMIEPVIEDYYRRETRNYCKVRDAQSVLATVRSSKKPGVVKHYKEQATKPGAEIMNYGDRYVAVNLQALEAHGTIEFRAMGPVYNYDHLIRWATFVREMVAISKKNVPAKVWTSVKTWRDLEKVLVKYGTEVPEYRLAEIEAANEVREEALV